MAIKFNFNIAVALIARLHHALGRLPRANRVR